MKDEVALLASVTLLGVLLQAYFSLQVIWARRAFRVSPPLTTGPPEFERVYRAQVNCSEYFPLFLAMLWVAGIFFHEALCGLVYLFARLRYFQGYARSAQLSCASQTVPDAAAYDDLRGRTAGWQSWEEPESPGAKDGCPPLHPSV
ncbi:leukotriene C4 synthase isoform X4 [Marmota marmota marmota]|uniref:leukotriene C4 synthase isoform X4 n=1 Tax=Marmota flaviventris TaxID=93162 RepID=UPI000FFF8A0D|nr:leukotriene C4 synthase isoform X4 [Marmota flaviventris]XP_048640714.1 leukotriene C4 synthase isoform X4 [Marmota marmota marmota]